jgi:hypothetical protein
MWLSYATNHVASDVAADMKAHAESCAACRSEMIFSGKIAGILDWDSETPPENWTSEAIAQFGSARPDVETPIVFGNLVSDSYLRDEGTVRSGRSENRHLVFDLHEFEVDLALEYSGRQLNTVIGHMSGKREGNMGEFVAELRVAETIYSAKPNQFGEFSFSVDAPASGEPFELRCTFKEGPCAIVLIPG